MSRWTKGLIGLALALAAGWIAYGPLGRGAAFIDRTEALARAQVAAGGLPGIQVRLGRAPLSRLALLSGPANDFQREGNGWEVGLNGRVGATPGVSAVSWDPAARATPLLAETLAFTALFYLIGVGLGWVFFRPRRVGFL
jgi:hypothetical protein